MQDRTHQPIRRVLLQGTAGQFSSDRRAPDASASLASATTSSSFNTITSDRCDNAKLGKMSADRIDHCGLLPNEQMARAVEH
jgi:hypothetical protein